MNRAANIMYVHRDRLAAAGYHPPNQLFYVP